MFCEIYIQMICSNINSMQIFLPYLLYFALKSINCSFQVALQSHLTLTGEIIAHKVPQMPTHKCGTNKLFWTHCLQINYEMELRHNLHFSSLFYQRKQWTCNWRINSFGNIGLITLHCNPIIGYESSCEYENIVSMVTVIPDG